MIHFEADSFSERGAGSMRKTFTALQREPGTPGIWERKMPGLRKTLEGAESTVGLVVPLCWAISP